LLPTFKTKWAFCLNINQLQQKLLVIAKHPDIDNKDNSPRSTIHLDIQRAWAFCCLLFLYPFEIWRFPWQE